MGIERDENWHRARQEAITKIKTILAKRQTLRASKRTILEENIAEARTILESEGVTVESPFLKKVEPPAIDSSFSESPAHNPAW